MKRSSHHEEEKMETPNNQNLVMKGDVKTTKQVKGFNAECRGQTCNMETVLHTQPGSPDPLSR